MPPVVAAVATFAVTVGHAIAGALAVVSAFAAAHPILWAVGKIAISIGASLLMSASAKKKAGQLNQGSQLSLKLDPAMPRQIPLGYIATGGSGVYAWTYTDNVDVPNKYLVRVISLSDVPINAITAVKEGDQTLAFTGDITTDLRPCTTHLDKDGQPHMWLKVHLGSYTPTADSWLIAHEPNSAWTSDHKGVGQAYAIVVYELDADGDAFPNGEPQIYFVVEGAKVYDQRYDSTRSSPTRTGSQRLDDPTTWVYSENTSVLLQQVMRGFTLNGKLLMGAQAEDRDLPDDMLLSAYNICDETVTNADASTEARYRSGYILQSVDSTQTAISELANAMDGDVFDRGGIITILPGKGRSIIMDLDDTDIVWTDEKSYQPEASLDALYNTVIGSYINSAAGFTQAPYPIRTDPDFITDDGGERIVINRDFGAIVYGTQCQRVTARLLAKSRFQAVVGFVGPLWLWELEQGDWFTLTSTRWGFTDKVFEVSIISLTRDMRVALVAHEIDTSVDTFDPAEQEVADTGTEVSHSADPSLPIPVIEVTADTHIADDGLTSWPVLNYTVSVPPGSTANAVNIQFRIASSGEIWDLPPLGLTGGEASSYYSSGLMPSTSYQMRARAYNEYRNGEWSSWDTATTETELTVPNASGLGGTDAGTILTDLGAATERTESYWSVTVNASATSAAFIMANSVDGDGDPTSDVGIGAREISLYNPAGGGLWKLAMRITDGNVLFTGGLNVGTYLRLGTGTGWPVALDTVKFVGGDGDLIEFGTDLGVIPQIVFDINSATLPTPPEGDTIVIKTVDLTSTGFEVSARVMSPGTITGRSSSTGTTPGGGGPTWQQNKTTSNDAYNGNYTLKASGNIRIQKNTEYYPPGPHGEGGGSFPVYYYGLVLRFWYYDGTWHDLGTAPVYPSFTDSGWSDGSYHDVSYALTQVFNISSALGSGGKFGVSIDSYTYAEDTITSQPAATWSSQSLTDNGSATPNGETIDILVTPKNASGA